MGALSPLRSLASELSLGALLDEASRRWGRYDLVAHWKQGEFHHDVVVALPAAAASDLGGSVLVVATNCNGGVKELLCFDEVPERAALWHRRCPTSEEFAGDLPALRGEERTVHWFDPCELLSPDARSELRPEHRRRQSGGGWEPSV
jgi:hypothetical protein